jgi:hypothetical protein
MGYNAFQQRRIDAGLCKDCGSERGSDGTSVFCRPCADGHSRRQSARKARLRAEWAQAGATVCNNCGTLMPDGTFKLCERCRDHFRSAQKVAGPRRRARKEAAGECANCAEPALRPSRYCRKHVLENGLRKHGIEADRYEEFWKKLQAQGFRCYYTGELLVPGVNASIDHRVPTSRGGSRTDIDNCVWCDRDVNAFKNDLTEEEFVQRCKAIAERFS